MRGLHALLRDKGEVKFKWIKNRMRSMWPDWEEALQLLRKEGDLRKTVQKKVRHELSRAGQGRAGQGRAGQDSAEWRLEGQSGSRCRTGQSHSQYRNAPSTLFNIRN